MSSMYGNRGPTGQMSGNKIPSGYQRGQIQNFSPEQMDLFQRMFSQLGPDSFLGKLAGGDESFFQQLEAPAMRQFSGQLGNLASRFSGAGGTGSRHSSGFNLAGTQAASDFAQDLQSKRLGLQSQAVRDLSSMSHELLNQRPYEQFLSEKKPSFLQSLLGGLGGGLSSGAGQAGGQAGMMQLLKLFGLL